MNKSFKILVVILFTLLGLFVLAVLNNPVIQVSLQYKISLSVLYALAFFVWFFYFEIENKIKKLLK